MHYFIDYKNIFYPVAHRPQGYIDTFSTRYDRFDPSIINEVFFYYFKKKPDAIARSTSWGTSHLIYFVKINKKEYVFRANNGQTNPEVTMLAEKVITDKLAKIDIPVNKVVYVDVSRKKFNFDYQIEERFAGEDIESIWEKFNNDELIYNKISFELGVLIAKMSKVKTEKYGLFNPVFLNKKKLAGYHNTFFEYIDKCLYDDLKSQAGLFISSKQVDQIYALFEKHKQLLNSLKPSIVHHDLADHNIAINPKTNEIVALFDWESSCSGSSLLDLASCPTWRTPFPRKDILIQGYKSLKRLPDSWEDIFNILKLRTVIWKNLFLVRANLLEEKHIVRMEDALAPFKIKPKVNFKKLLKK